MSRWKKHTNPQGGEAHELVDGEYRASVYRGSILHNWHAYAGNQNIGSGGEHSIEKAKSAAEKAIAKHKTR